MGNAHKVSISMKLLKFLFPILFANASQIAPENNLAALAAQIEELKFFIADITRSRDDESKHLQARLIELEDHFQQQRLLQQFPVTLKSANNAPSVDPELLAQNEQKAERSYKDKVMSIINGF